MAFDVLKSSLCLVLLLTTTTVLVVSGKKCAREPRCVCKWSSGMRVAECINADLSSIPSQLDPEIQTLILDGNPIVRLEEDAFKNVNLLHLQRLSMRDCGLLEISDGAFRDLKNLMYLDLSRNNLTELRPGVFDGNDGLQTFSVAYNSLTRLVAYQFPPLRNLKSIDVSHCQISQVDKNVFKNLHSSVKSVLLNDNKLKSVAPEVFVTLPSLKKLQLHGNPWICDCKLNNFRDWLLAKNLYVKPTACNEPARLHDKMWDDISSSEFACKPFVEIPSPYVFGATGLNATLPCKVTGSPSPEVRWVIDGRIVNNNTNLAPLSNQMWFILDRYLADRISRWYNLTVTNLNYNNLGTYVCVAENSAGVMEKQVMLTFDDPASLTHLEGNGGGHFSKEYLAVVIGVTTASGLFLAIMVLIIFMCCCCRHRKHSKSSGRGNSNSTTSGNNVNGKSNSVTESESGRRYLISNTQNNPGGSIFGTEYQGLLSPEVGESDSLLTGQLLMSMPPQAPRPSHQISPYDMETRRELSVTPSTASASYHRGVMMPSSCRPQTSSSSAGADSSLHSSSQCSAINAAATTPDLLDHQTGLPMDCRKLKKTSTPMNLNATALMSGSQRQLLSPSPSPSNVSIGISPFQRSSLLPPQVAASPLYGSGIYRPRTLSCDPNDGIPANSQGNVPAHPHGVVGLPFVQVPSALLPNQGPGYVTLPRRPRGSWSAGPPLTPRDSPTPSQLYYVTHNPRTSNSGSPGTLMGKRREPIYDGVGPRTSADGSSRLKLNVVSSSSSSKTLPRNHPKNSVGNIHGSGSLPRGGGHGGGTLLLPYCAPIEEVQECPPTPKMQQAQMDERLPKSTPNMQNLVSDTTSQSNHINNESMTSSNQTLDDEENVSGYCEPFGKALLSTGSGNENKSPNGVTAKPPLPIVKDEAKNLLILVQEEGSSVAGRSKVKPRPVPPPKPMKKTVPEVGNSAVAKLKSSCGPKMTVVYQDEVVEGGSEV